MIEGSVNAIFCVKEALLFRRCLAAHETLPCFLIYLSQSRDRNHHISDITFGKVMRQYNWQYSILIIFKMKVK